MEVDTIEKEIDVDILDNNLDNLVLERHVLAN